MEWFTIIALILFGLILIIIEVIFVPGTTFVGIVGFGIAGFGVWQSFVSFGTETGLIVLSVSSLVAIAAIFYSFKSGVWKRFALEGKHNARFNDEVKHNLVQGDVGVAVSTLRPMGTAEFRDKLYEVRTNGNYLETGTKVRIERIANNAIIVVPLEDEHSQAESSS